MNVYALALVPFLAYVALLTHLIFTTGGTDDE